MKKMIVLLLIGLVLFLSSGALLLRHSLACELLPALGYPHIQAGAFAAPDLDPESLEAMHEILVSAADRISEVYGPPEARPRILVTGDVATARRWGANETASMHRLPWRSCIVVGPQGQNVDVLAHESLHAEIQHRVGFVRFFKEVPVWFDEGAALTLDYREPFLPENIDLSSEQVIGVRELARAKDFFTGNVREKYQAARMAVIPLIDTETFFEDLGRIADGENFEAVFVSP